MTLNIQIESGFPLVTVLVEGHIDTQSAPQFLDTLTKLQLSELEELRIIANKLTFMSSAGLRALVFAKQKMPHSSRLIVVGAAEPIADVIVKTGLSSAVMLVNRIEDIP
jgi:anti-anti-sigma factor